MIVELARFKNLFVSSQSAVSSYESKTADPRVVGRELGVKHVLLGQVRRIGERVRISVRRVDASSGENLWAERYERRWDELFELLDELIARIAATIVGQVQADIAEALAAVTLWKKKFDVVKRETEIALKLRACLEYTRQRGTLLGSPLSRYPILSEQCASIRLLRSNTPTFYHQLTLSPVNTRWLQLPFESASGLHPRPTYREAC